MAFQHKTDDGRVYNLHSQIVKLKGSGIKQTIYYFSQKKGKYAIDELPAGYKNKMLFSDLIYLNQKRFD